MDDNLYDEVRVIFVIRLISKEKIKLSPWVKLAGGSRYVLSPHLLYFELAGLIG